eukprot:355413-Chlamydomonas_euryale.AAC.2
MDVLQTSGHHPPPHHPHNNNSHDLYPADCQSVYQPDSSAFRLMRCSWYGTACCGRRRSCRQMQQACSRMSALTWYTSSWSLSGRSLPSASTTFSGGYTVLPSFPTSYTTSGRSILDATLAGGRGRDVSQRPGPARPSSSSRCANPRLSALNSPSSVRSRSESGYPSKEG